MPYSTLQTTALKAKTRHRFKGAGLFCVPIAYLDAAKIQKISILIKLFEIFCSKCCRLQKIMYFCGTKKRTKIIQWKRNQIIAQLQKIVPIKAACCPLYGVRAADRFQRAPFFLKPYY